MILILSQDGDLHTDIVAECLEHKKAPYVIFKPEHLSITERLSLHYSDSEHFSTLFIEGQSIPLTSITSVWYRRPRQPRGSPLLEIQDNEFVIAESNQAIEGLWNLLRNCFWVNSHKSCRIAQNKAYQLEIARISGLAIPRTLITNDPDHAKRFLERCNGEIIYKTLSGYIRTENTTNKGYGIYTNRVTEAELEARSQEIAFAPCLFQEWIPKSTEYRVTVIGSRIFAFEIDTQNTDTTSVDWRRGGPGSIFALRHRLKRLPADLETQIQAFMKALGIVFGCIDLILTPEGRFIFLEINPSGQWGWLEHVTGVPLVDNFTEMLIQASPRYKCEGTFQSRLIKDADLLQPQ
jgi:glutathione synthase/RimK-type ligase-like ATP-grasp enzyme